MLQVIQLKNWFWCVSRLRRLPKFICAFYLTRAICREIFWVTFIWVDISFYPQSSSLCSHERNTSDIVESESGNFGLVVFFCILAGNNIHILHQTILACLVLKSGEAVEIHETPWRDCDIALVMSLLSWNRQDFIGWNTVLPENGALHFCLGCIFAFGAGLWDTAPAKAWYAGLLDLFSDVITGTFIH